MVTVDHALHPISLSIQGLQTKHGIELVKSIFVLPQVDVHFCPTQQARNVVGGDVEALVQVGDARFESLSQVKGIRFCRPRRGVGGVGLQCEVQILKPFSNTSRAKMPSGTIHIP